MSDLPVLPLVSRAARVRKAIEKFKTQDLSGYEALDYLWGRTEDGNPSLWLCYGEGFKIVQSERYSGVCDSPETAPTGRFAEDASNRINGLQAPQNQPGLQGHPDDLEAV